MRQYYEIRRAQTIAEISGARHGHGDATAQKELPAVEANPTGSKVHPADKYTEAPTVPLVDLTRAPSAMVP